MNTRLVLLTMTALIIVAPLTAEIVDGVAVKINGDIITISEVDEAVASVNQMGQAVERGVVIEKLIEKQLVVQEARRQHVTVNPDDIDEQVDAEIESIKRRLGGEDGLEKQLERENISYEELRRQYRRRVRQQLLFMRMMQNKERQFKESVTIDEGEIESYLKEHGDAYRSADVSVISFPLPRKASGPARDRLETKARRVLDRLRGGEDFAKLAVENDPAAEGNVGHIGRVNYAEFPEELAEVVFSVSKRELDKPVFRTGKHGFYILRISEMVEATQENSGMQVRSRLIQEKTNEKFDSWLKGLREKAYVKFME